MIAVPLWLFFAGIIFVAILINLYHKKQGETADIIEWANIREPIFVEQTIPGIFGARQAVEAHQMALAKLKEHGNDWLGKTEIERRRNVHLWVHGADAQNPEIDFDRWKAANIERRKSILEAYRQLKAENAANYGKVEQAAKVMANDFDDILLSNGK